MYGNFPWTTDQVTLQDPFSMPSNQHLRRVWHQWSPTLAKRLRTFYKLIKKMLTLAKHENNDKNLMMNLVYCLGLEMLAQQQCNNNATIIHAMMDDHDGLS